MRARVFITSIDLTGKFTFSGSLVLLYNMQIGRQKLWDIVQEEQKQVVIAHDDTQSTPLRKF